MPFLLLLISAAIAAVGAGAPAPHATLRYLGHSCFVLTTPGGLTILIDPFTGEEWPGLTFPPVHADRVLVTHRHWDHDAWRAVQGKPKLFEGPGRLKAGDAVVTAHEGRHALTGGEGIAYRNTVFVLETAGLRICHPGDNGPIGETAGLAESIGRVDVLLLPIDGEHRVLTDEQAQEWIEALAPRIVIPMHYRIPGLSFDHITGIGSVDSWLSRQPSSEVIPSDLLVLDPSTFPPPGAGEVRALTLPGQKPPGGAGSGAGLAEAAEAKRRAEKAVAGGDIATAIAELTGATEMAPGDAAALRMLGFLHLGGARPERALELLRRCAEAAGEEEAATASLCWLGSGMALDLLGRREQAREAYRQVMEIGVNDELQVDQARRWMESPYSQEP